MATTPPRAESLPGSSPLSRGRDRELHDLIFRLLCRSAAVLVLVVLVLLIVFLLNESWPAIVHFGGRFLVSKSWNPTGELGALAFIWGTVVTAALAMLLAVPLGVGTAAYLAEIAPGWLRRGGSFLIELLAAIPSVVYGFWGYYFLTPGLKALFDYLDAPLQRLAEVPGLGWVYTPNNSGNGLLAAGLILAIMIVPYVTAIAFDVCRAVPRSQREGCLALGGTRWQTIWSVVLPYARPGIIGGCFLALGRALGETMAVVMLIGNNQVISLSPLGKGATIASVIANELNESEGVKRSALVELGLVLLLVSMVVNCIARLLIWRVGRPGGWWPFPRRQRTPARDAAATPETPPAAQEQRAAAGVREELAKVARGGGLLTPTDQMMTTGLGRCWLVAFGVCLLFGVALGFGVLPAVAATVWLFRLCLVLVVAGLAVLVGYAEYRGNITRDWLMTRVLAASFLVTAVPLFLILGYVTFRGVTALDWNFFTHLPNDDPPGLAHALYGSTMLVGLATLFAVPIGILTAVFLAEERNSRLAPPVRFVGELLGGVPSIIWGIFGYAVVVARVGHFSGWAGVLALAVMMLPVVMRASEEALKLVPQSLRNASYALGAAHWQTVLRVTVPAALPAIITGVFLAIARIAGETAPLLLTADSTLYWASTPDRQTPYLTYYIYFWSQDPDDQHQRLAWAAAFVLLAVVMLLNVGIRLAAGKRIVSAARAD
jgi:phosphate transport system permease protein